MITRLVPTLLGTTLGLVAAAGAAAATKPPAPSAPLAAGSLATATGRPAGTATITVAPGGSPILRIKASGLPPGVHGVHIHATGKCEGPAFASAGGHLNPAGHQHGKGNPAGSHLGDLPNLTVDAHGHGELVQTMTGDPVTLRAQLLDADGAAVIVHADADDYRTDPSGNSGARIACAVLKGS